MDRATLRQTLADLMKRVSGETPPELEDSDILLQKVKLDSFSFVSLVLELEEKFYIRLPDVEVQRVTTVGSLLDLILDKIHQAKTKTLPMKAKAAAMPPPAPATLEPFRAAVRAYGFVDIPLVELDKTRETLAAAGKSNAAKSIARLCDEQTVLGVAAVADAMRRGSMSTEEQTNWGVLASSRFLGRRTSLSVYHRCMTGGPSRMTPLLIPFVSLHAGSSVVSVYFDCHGPTYGVSGCPDNVTEGILNGLTVPVSPDSPGTWLVFTAWEPEPVCNEKGETETPSRGYGVALGLTEWSAQSPLQVTYQAPSRHTNAEMPTMQQLVAAVAQLESGTCRLPLSTGGTLLIEQVAQSKRAAA